MSLTGPERLEVVGEAWGFRVVVPRRPWAGAGLLGVALATAVLAPRVVASMPGAHAAAVLALIIVVLVGLVATAIPRLFERTRLSLVSDGARVEDAPRPRLPVESVAAVRVVRSDEWRVPPTLVVATQHEVVVCATTPAGIDPLMEGVARRLPGRAPAWRGCLWTLVTGADGGITVHVHPRPSSLGIKGLLLGSFAFHFWMDWTRESVPEPGVQHWLIAMAAFLVGVWLATSALAYIVGPPGRLLVTGRRLPWRFGRRFKTRDIRHLGNFRPVRLPVVGWDLEGRNARGRLRRLRLDLDDADALRLCRALHRVRARGPREMAA